MQPALVGSSGSWHFEVCKALEGSFGVVHSIISDCGISRSRGCQIFRLATERLLAISFSDMRTFQKQKRAKHENEEFDDENFALSLLFN